MRNFMPGLPRETGFIRISLNSLTPDAGDLLWGDRAAGNRALRTCFIRFQVRERKGWWWKFTIQTLFTAVMAVLGVSGCGILDPSELERQQDRLEESQRLWERNGPSTYTFVIERLCFCPAEITSPVRVAVTDRVVTSRKYVASGLPVPSQWASLYPSIDGVFGIVAEAIERRADKLDIEYDPALGYPRSAFIDYVEEAVDEELVVRVRDVTPN
jgi:hypothetical protein